MKLITVFRLVLIFSLTLASRIHAIPDLRLTIQNQNVVLTWPSETGQFFIVEHRVNLDESTPWVTLATSYPAATTGTRTTFTHIGVVSPSPSPGTGGSGGNGSPPLPTAVATTGFDPDLGPIEATMEPALRSPAPIRNANQRRLRIPSPTPPLPPEGRGQGKAALPNRPDFESTQFASLASPSDGSIGFYRVVQTGVKLYGLTSGQIVQGAVSFSVEVGATAQPMINSIIILDADTGESIPGLEHSDSGQLSDFVWNTSFSANRLYRLKAVATFGDGQTGASLESSTHNVTVANKIWFPTGINLAGGLFGELHVAAQTAFPNGTYQVEIFEETGLGDGQPLAVVEGVTDSAGFLLYDGVRDFIVDITFTDPLTGDTFLLPSRYYTIVIAAQAAANGGQGGAQGSPESATATKLVPVETWWPIETFPDVRTKFTIGYQPVFGNPTGGGVSQVALQSMVQAVYSITEARGLGVEPGNSQAPFEIYGQADFDTWLINHLRQPTVRNLFYYGHGGDNFLGRGDAATPNGVLGVSKLDISLQNRSATGGVNRHPFRFVMLFGCKTANGELPNAFGIPKKKGMTRQDFWKQSLRPRAFVGSKTSMTHKIAGSFNPDHANFVTHFFNSWAIGTYQIGHPKAGQPLGLKDAILIGAKFGNPNGPVRWTGYTDLVIYGAEDLTFSDAGDIDPQWQQP